MSLKTTKSFDIIKILVEFYKWQPPCLLTDAIDVNTHYVKTFHESIDEKKINDIIKKTDHMCFIFNIAPVLPPTYLLCLLKAHDIINQHN